VSGCAPLGIKVELSAPSRQILLPQMVMRIMVGKGDLQLSLDSEPWGGPGTILHIFIVLFFINMKV
jgi:hypothetical protein